MAAGQPESCGMQEGEIGVIEAIEAIKKMTLNDLNDHQKYP